MRPVSWKLSKNEMVRALKYDLWEPTYKDSLIQSFSGWNVTFLFWFIKEAQRGAYKI